MPKKKHLQNFRLKIICNLEFYTLVDYRIAEKIFTPS